MLQKKNKNGTSQGQDILSILALIFGECEKRVEILLFCTIVNSIDIFKMLIISVEGIYILYSLDIENHNFSINQNY